MEKEKEVLCNLCPRKCNVNRKISIGFCGAKETLKVAKTMIHFWEEPIISGTEETLQQGSGAIFFSHCNLKCVYCQNYEISTLGKGTEISVLELVGIMKDFMKQNVCNINFVTPTHFSNKIIEALRIFKPNIPIIWNTSGYESPEDIKKLKGIVDIFLCDFKYYDNNLALKLSKCSNYFENCTKSLIEMRKIVGRDVIEDGLMKKGIIIRHLVLPNCIKDSFSVLDWIAKNMGTDTYISLMSQFTPCGDVLNISEFNRKLKPLEYKLVKKHLLELGFSNGFLQDFESSSSDYIPNF